MAQGTRDFVKTVAPAFQMPSREVLQAWWYNLQCAMAEANKANVAYDKAVAVMKARREVNNWNDTVYRDLCKKDWGINDALDAWKFYTSEVHRFQAAIAAAAEMKRLLG